MKRSLLLVGALLFASSQAQDGAAQIFERAKAAHGGAALETMTAYRDAGTITYFDAKGQVAAKVDFKQIYDLQNSRIRIEILQNQKPVQIIQTTPLAAWSWTEQSGVVRLPATQAKPIRDTMYQGLFSLRAKTSQLTDLKVVGTVKIGNVEGTLLNFKWNAIPSAPVIAADGTVIGSQETVDGVLVQGASSDLRTVGGVRVVFQTTSSANGQMAFALKLENAEVNPNLTDADFAQPK
jgi:hypothetical protein